MRDKNSFGPFWGTATMAPPAECTMNDWLSGL